MFETINCSLLLSPIIYTSIFLFASNAELKTQFAPFTGEAGELSIVCQKLNVQLSVSGLLVIMNFNGNTALCLKEFEMVVSFPESNTRSYLRWGASAMIH